MTENKDVEAKDSFIEDSISQQEAIEKIRQMQTQALLKESFETTKEILGEQNIADVIESIKDTNKINKVVANANQEQQEQKQVYLTKRDIANLKRNGYNEAIRKYKQSFVILNKKTGMVVEMKAASSTHACNMIGWRINNCKLLDVIEEKTDLKDLTDIANPVVVSSPNYSPVEVEIVPESKENVE